MENLFVEDKIYSKDYPFPSSTQNEDFTILRCQFLNISSDGNGGAVSIQMKDISIDINQSLFYGCCAKSGGALFFDSIKRIDLKFSCFSKCSSNWVENQEGNYVGSACYIVNTNEIDFRFVSTDNCPNTKNFDKVTSGAQFDVHGVEISFNNINSSGSSSIYTGCIEFRTKQKMKSQFLTLMEATCGYVIAFTGPLNNVDYANFACITCRKKRNEENALIFVNYSTNAILDHITFSKMNLNNAHNLYFNMGVFTLLNSIYMMDDSIMNYTGTLMTAANYTMTNSQNTFAFDQLLTAGCQGNIKPNITESSYFTQSFEFSKSPEFSKSSEYSNTFGFYTTNADVNESSIKKMALITGISFIIIIVISIVVCVWRKHNCGKKTKKQDDYDEIYQLSTSDAVTDELVISSSIFTAPRFTDDPFEHSEEVKKNPLYDYIL